MNDLDKLIEEINKMAAQILAFQGQIERLRNKSVLFIPDVEAEEVSRETGANMDFMPDGNCAHTSSNQKKTLEWQPGTGDHRNELQMVNADGLTASTKGNVPYIDIDSSGNGELGWIHPTYDYQVLTRKSDDTIAFDWVRAHG